MLDILIINGTVYDGSGTEPFRANIGIKGDRILMITPNMPKASKIIDASGLAVSPGFIDIHSHTDFTIIDNPQAESKIMQGVTTEVVGNCGFSPAPVRRKYFNVLMDYFSNTVSLSEEEKKKWRWANLYDFYEEIENKGISVNLVPLMGYGTLRVAFSGFPKEPSPLLLEVQKKLLYQIEKEMEGGIWGISTALEYPPCSYAGIEEMVEACKVVKRYDGIYSTHIREEKGEKVFKSIDEAIKVAQLSGVNLEISHLKAAGRENWGRARDILNRIHLAQQKGISVDTDQYPYPAWGSSILDFLPEEVVRQGSNYWENLLINKKSRKTIEDYIRSNPDGPEKDMGWKGILIAAVKTNNNLSAVGKNLEELSEIRKKSPEEIVVDLLLEEEGCVKMIVFCMQEEDIKCILEDSKIMIGSDGRAVAPYGKYGKTHPHPRYYGTFPRILGKYVREEQVISLTEAIRKMTYLPATKIGLENRGKISMGAFADITIFNPQTIIDVATFENPHCFPRGIEEVIVNGRIVVEKGKLTSALPGHFLRRT